MRQHVTGQRHGGRPAHRVYGTHVEPHDDQCAEERKGDERREGQAEQGQEQQIDPVPVEVVQQVTGHRTEQDGGHRHGGEHHAHPGPRDADLLAVDGNDGDGGIESRQHQQVGDEEKDEPSVPDFFGLFHKIQDSFLAVTDKYGGNCHYFGIARIRPFVNIQLQLPPKKLYCSPKGGRFHALADGQSVQIPVGTLP